MGEGHELVHPGAFLGAVNSAKIHNVLLAEKAPIRIHYDEVGEKAIGLGLLGCGLFRARDHSGSRDQMSW